MRNSILLLTTALVLAACADDQHPSAPSRSRSIASSSGAGDLVTTQGIGIPQAKPVDEVGFTKVQTVFSTSIVVTPGTSGGRVALCPEGTTLVGGGYSIPVWGGTPPFVNLNLANASGTGWVANVYNANPAGGPSVELLTIARCAS